MSTEFTIRLEPPRNGSHVVTIAGELDIAVAPEVSAFLARLDGAVVLDCADLSFVDASGIRALERAAERLDHLRLVNLQPGVRRVFELTDTTWLLAPVADGEHDAGASGGDRQRRSVAKMTMTATPSTIR